MNTEHVVEMKGICKRFGGVHALRSVDLELRRGEIMGIVGDNGAGKSTLMKILSGAYLADEGEIYIDGRQAHIRNPHDAFHLGIGMIYQDLALFDNLDLMRIYMRPRGAETDYEEPLIIRRGATVRNVCDTIHRDIKRKFRYAKVWGESAKFPGQDVGLDHILADHDVITIVQRK